MKESGPDRFKVLSQIYCLKEIQRAMAVQKHFVNEYLDKYEISSQWDKIKKGFLYNNIETKLRRIVKLVPCGIETTSPVYLLPFNKAQKIFVCYNKIESYESLQRELTRKMVIAYDIMAKGMDYNNPKQLAHSQIKALNLSKTCKRGDLACFKKHIEQISTKEPFAGKTDYFDLVFDEAIHDVQPMNELKFL